MRRLALISMLALTGPALATAAGPPLVVLSFSCDTEHSHTYVRGEVKNISDEPIDGLMVVGELRQDDGTLVKTADAMVDYLPLMPGQTSPFEAITRLNPLATKCSLGFKTMFGPELPYTHGGGE